MSQKYKIFINNKIVYIVDNPSIVASELLSNDHYIIQPFKSRKALSKLLDILQGEVNESNVVLYGEDVNKIFEEIEMQFLEIKAAGGVIINEKDEVLMIHRKGYWDLPKGKLDNGETIAQAAIREVKEETGLKNVELLSPITFEGLLNTATYHTYVEKGKEILKASYWFMMKGNSMDALVPQSEEDILEAKWLSKEEVQKLLPQMYLSIRDVIKEVFR